MIVRRSCNSQTRLEVIGQPGETPGQRDARMKWWREARFGMFIHWGVYKEIGKWMKVNGESIYATTASPFNRLSWGWCTKKLNNAGATLYLHVFDWPKDGKLAVPGLRNEVRSALLLATDRTLRTATRPSRQSSSARCSLRRAPTS